MEFITLSGQQTKKLAKKIAGKVIAQKLPRVVGLAGNLGAGKTTFIQGFAEALGIKEKILSPTFIILREFKIRANSRSNSCKFASFYHIDCYRIGNPKEIIELNWQKIIRDPKNIVLIEWADKIKKIMPKKSLWIKFEHLGKNKRRIKSFVEKSKP